MIDASFINAVADLVRQGETIQVVRPPAEPPHVYLTVTPEGEIRRHEAEPAPRASVAYDLATVVRFAVDHSGAVGGADPVADAELWYSRAGVVCLLDGEQRRDRVTLALRHTPQVQRLGQLSERSPSWLDQKAFLRMLRVDLAGCCPDSLVGSVRSLRFQVNTQGEQAIAHGKASLGKAITAELRGDEAIPEDVLLYVSAFEGFGDLYPCRCLVEIDPAGQRLALTPLPGEVERVFRAAELDLSRALAALLREQRGITDGDEYAEPVDVFYGQP